MHWSSLHFHYFVFKIARLKSIQVLALPLLFIGLILMEIENELRLCKKKIIGFSSRETQSPRDDFWTILLMSLSRFSYNYPITTICNYKHFVTTVTSYCISYLLLPLQMKTNILKTNNSHSNRLKTYLNQTITKNPQPMYTLFPTTILDSFKESFCFMHMLIV